MSSGPGVSGLRRIRQLKDQKSNKIPAGNESASACLEDSQIIKGPSGVKRCYPAGGQSVPKPSSVYGKENSEGTQSAVPKKQRVNYSTRQGNELSKKSKEGDACANTAKESTPSHKPDIEAATERWTQLLGDKMSTSSTRDVAIARATARLKHTTPRKINDYTPTEQLISMFGKNTSKPNMPPPTSSSLANKSNEVPLHKVASTTTEKVKEMTPPGFTANAIANGNHCQQEAGHTNEAAPEVVNQVPTETITELENEMMPEDSNGDINEEEALEPVANSDNGVKKVKTRRVLNKTARGVARGESLEKFVAKNGKYKICFLPGEAVSVYSDEQFSSAIGVIVKGHADLGKDITGWEKVPKTTKEFCYARIDHLFDIEDIDSPRVQMIIDRKFKKAYTRWRSTLNGCYKSLVANNISPRTVTPRKDLTLQKWNLACDFIEDKKFKERSSTNSKNRAKMQFNQTTGRTPFLTRFKNMKAKSEIEFFKETRSSKTKGGDFVNPAAKSKYEEMVEMRNKCSQTEEGSNVQEAEIVKSALGHRSGYIKGMGHGLQVTRGTASTFTGIHINQKLAELDSANEKIAELTKANEEQENSMKSMKLQMEKWDKLLKALPGASQLLTDGALDEDEST